MELSLSDYIDRNKDTFRPFGSRGAGSAAAARAPSSGLTPSARGAHLAGVKRQQAEPPSGGKRAKLQVGDARERLQSRRTAECFDARSRIGDSRLRQAGGDLRSKLSHRRPAPASAAGCAPDAGAAAPAVAAAFSSQASPRDLRLKIKTSVVDDVSPSVGPPGPLRFISAEDPESGSGGVTGSGEHAEDYRSLTVTRGTVIGAMFGNRDAVASPGHRAAFGSGRHVDYAEFEKAVPLYNKDDRIRSQSRYSQSSSTTGGTVLVSNLHPVVTEEDIVELFSVVGPLVYAKMKVKGTAEVQFVRADDALKSLKRYHNRELDGIPMDLRIVQPPATDSNRLKGPGSDNRHDGFGDLDVSLIHKALFNKGSTSSAKIVGATTFTVKI